VFQVYCGSDMWKKLLYNCRHISRATIRLFLVLNIASLFSENESFGNKFDPFDLLLQTLELILQHPVIPFFIIQEQEYLCRPSLHSHTLCTASHVASRRPFCMNLILSQCLFVIGSVEKCVELAFLNLIWGQFIKNDPTD